MRLLTFDEHGALRFTKNLPTERLPPYTILSHTWSKNDEDEVQYSELRGADTQQKFGYAKLMFCAEQTKADGLEYFWVDTCCINKADLTELSEAINSMFLWYTKANKCYVYLSDVHTLWSDKFDWKLSFRTSNWFKRGWTLQELLAPKTVEFFSKEGKSIGTKLTLVDDIEEITSIPKDALQGRPLFTFPIPERMRWIEGRSTTKPEDLAYCQQGIFAVNMNLRYGEGRDEAMNRLKRKIEKRSHKEIIGVSQNMHESTPSNVNSTFDPSKIADMMSTMTKVLSRMDAETTPRSVLDVRSGDKSHATSIRISPAELPLRNLLDLDCRNLIGMPQHDVARRIEFIKDHKQLTGPYTHKKIYDSLIAQAAEFSHMANACIQSLALIELVKQESIITGTSLADALKDINSPSAQNLRQINAQLREVTEQATQRSLHQSDAYKDQARIAPLPTYYHFRGEPTRLLGRKTMPSQIPTPRPRGLVRLGGTSSETSASTKGSFRQSQLSNTVIDGSLFSEPYSMRASSPPDSGVQLHMNKQSSERPSRFASSASLYCDASSDDDLPSEYPHYHTPPYLPSIDFHIMRDDWFQPGRVFQMSRSEPRGSSVEDVVATSISGIAEVIDEQAYEKESRLLVVIRNNDSSCWCVPIYTYGGTGLTEPTLKPADVHAHAIVYDAKRQPTRLRGEPKIERLPIAINLRDYEYLDSASRVHLGRPTDISKSTEVRYVGRIEGEDLKLLVKYVKEELLED